MKKVTIRVFFVLLNITFVISFCLKNIKTIDNFSDFLGGNIHNVLRNFLQYVFRILLNNYPQQIHSILPKM